MSYPLVPMLAVGNMQARWLMRTIHDCCPAAPSSPHPQPSVVPCLHACSFIARPDQGQALGEWRGRELRRLDAEVEEVLQVRDPFWSENAWVT